LPKDAARLLIPEPAAESQVEKIASYLLLGFAGIWAASRCVSSGDLWVALGCGRYILGNGVTRIDPFSFTSPPGAWVNQNWLTHVLFTLIDRFAGLTGLGILKILVCIAIVLVSASTARRLGATRLAATAAGLATAVVGRSFFDLRPNLLTVLLAAVLIRWIVRLDRRTLGASWPLVPFVILWANLHGGFLIALLTLGAAFAVAALVHLRGQHRLADWPRILLLPLLCLGATLVSPYGLTNLTHPYEVSLGPAAEHWRDVVEWRSPYAAGAWEDPGVRAFWIALAVVLVVAVLAAALRRHRRTASGLWPIGGVALLTLLLSLTSRRFVPVFAVAAFPALAGFIGDSWMSRRLRSVLVTIFAVVVALLTTYDFAERLLLPNGLWSRADSWAQRLVRYDEQPRDAVRFLVTSNLEGRLLNDWTWGGYLLSQTPFDRGRARYQIFIDGRAQAAYPVQISEDWIAVGTAAAARDSGSVAAFLDYYRVDLTLIDRRGPGLDRIIPQLEEWVSVYADDQAVLAARRNRARTLLSGEFPDAATARTSVALHLKTRGNMTLEETLAAFQYLVEGVREKPTTTGVTEMTRLALSAPEPLRASFIDQATAACDEVLRRDPVGEKRYEAISVEANTAQSRAFLAKALGDSETERIMRRRAQERAAAAEAIARRVLR
jgi:hypothetical protein